MLFPKLALQAVNNVINHLKLDKWILSLVELWTLQSTVHLPQTSQSRARFKQQNKTKQQQQKTRSNQTTSTPESSIMTVTFGQCFHNGA